MYQEEMAAILGRTMMDEMNSKGFEFANVPAVFKFMEFETYRSINVSEYFLDQCNQYVGLNECLDHEKVSLLFGEVMGRYMRNRLIIVLPILYAFAALSIVSNALGIKAVVNIRHKLPRHWVLMKLSLSDALLAPLNAIKVTSEVFAYSQFDIIFRTYFNAVWQVFFLLTPISLLFLALDNVVAVVAPFFYERRSASGSRGFLLTIGASTLSAIILLIVLLHVFEVQHSQTVQLIVATVLLAIIATTVTLYVALAMKAEVYRRKLMYMARPSSVVSNDKQQREVLRSRMKTTATTLSIVLTLAGFWSPFIAYLLIPDAAKFTQVPFFIKFLCSALCLFQLGTTIDPIVYCCRMAEVRRSLFASVVPTSCRERFKPDFETSAAATLIAKRQSSIAVNGTSPSHHKNGVISNSTTSKSIASGPTNHSNLSEESVPLKNNNA